MILLDADTLTHFSYGNENVRRRIDEAADEMFAVTVVTRHEILRGRAENLLKASDKDELRTAAERFRQSEALLSDFAVVGFDEDSIAHFGRLRGQRNLRKMGRADMLVACIALARKALLVTRNTRDFKHVAGLRIDNWVD